MKTIQFKNKEMGKEKQTETNKTVKNNTTKEKGVIRDSCWTMERLEVLTVFFFMGMSTPGAE